MIFVTSKVLYTDYRDYIGNLHGNQKISITRVSQFFANGGACPTDYYMAVVIN